MTAKTNSQKNNNAASQNNASNIVDEAKTKINEREYYTRLVDMKEKVNAALPEGTKNYVTLMALMFPKYGDKKGRNLLRRVFNGQKQDLTVVADFESLPEKIKAVQG